MFANVILYSRVFYNAVAGGQREEDAAFRTLFERYTIIYSIYILQISITRHYTWWSAPCVLQPAVLLVVQYDQFGS